MMKELFLISSYTSNITQENQLRNLVFKLKEQNKNVFLISHSSTPDDIVKLCDYYFYDGDNILVPAYKTSGSWIFGNENFGLESHFNIFNYYNYSVAFSKTLYHGLLISKELGYSNVHFLVYDTDFTSLEEFDHNNELLKEYDGVSYFLTDTPINSTYSTLPSGYIISFNLDKFLLSELIFDEEKLTKELEVPRDGYLAEYSILKNFIETKNFFKKDITYPGLSKFKLNLSSQITNNSLRNCMFFVAIEEDTNNSLCFIHNPTSDILNLSILINDSLYYSFQVNSRCWEYKKIGDFEEINSIKFYHNSELLKVIEFNDPDFREEFRFKSKFWYH